MTGNAPISLDAVQATLQQLVQATNAEAAAIAAAFPAYTTVATSATAGTHGGAPAQVAGYLNVTISGTAYKIPLYLP